jgi:four helix bundle protein
MGSSSQVEYEFLLAKDLDYLTVKQYTNFNDEITRIKRMLTSLLRKLKPS